MAVTVREHLPTIGRHLVFTQYAAGLAVVLAVRSMPGYEDLPLFIKWPNDVYYCPGRDASDGDDAAAAAIKIGGVLVTSSTMGKEIDVFTGVGVNVSNVAPTVSLAQAVAHFNERRGTALAPLAVETVLARFLTQFETLVAAVEAGCASVVCRCLSVCLDSVSVSLQLHACL
jgi:biotin--protein ligase